VEDKTGTTAQLERLDQFASRKGVTAAYLIAMISPFAPSLLAVLQSCGMHRAGGIGMGAVHVLPASLNALMEVSRLQSSLARRCGTRRYVIASLAT